MKFRLLLTALCVAAGLNLEQAEAQGFPNVPQTPGTLLSGGLLEPNQGRTAIIAYHNGWLYTVPEHPSSQAGSDYQARRWNIADPGNVQVMETLGISGGSTSAHGFQKIGDYLLLGGNGFDFIHHETGERHLGLSYVFRATAPNINERTAYPQQHPIYSRGDLYRPYYTNMFWSYGNNDETAVLGFGTEQLAEWDHIGLTGVIGHPFIIGNLLIFASDQSRTGVSTYDISDPSNPVLLDVLTTGGPGGYWPELWGADGRLLIVFPYRTGGNGIRVVDVTDPNNMEFLADVPLPGASCMYAQFQDNYLFTGSHKVDMRTFSSVLSLDLEPTELDTSQFALPLGNLLFTGGAGPGQGMAIWAHQAEPDTSGPTVGYHIPRDGQTNYPTTAPISLLIHESLESPSMINGETFIVRPLGGDAIPGLIRWTFNDSLTFTPDSPLLANTTYEVVIPGGGITDAVGNGIEAYSFSFSTGSNVAGNQAPNITNISVSSYPALPSQLLQFQTEASDPEGDALEFRYDFGDGSEKTVWSASAEASHSYEEIGHYKAIAQVRDSSGSLRSSAHTVTVTTAITNDLPGRSTPLVIDQSSRTLWTVNPDNNSVTAFDADTRALLFETSVGEDPRSVDIDASGNAWVSLHDADALVVIDPSGQLIETIDLAYGAAPFGIVMTSDRQTAFVSLQGSGDLVRFNTSTRMETGRLELGPTPRALALSPNNDRLFVTRLISPLHQGEIWEINPTTMTLNRRLEIEKFGGNFHRDGTAEGMGVANYLTGLAVSPDGEELFVSSNKMNTDKGTLSGPDLDPDNTVRNIVSRFDVNTGQFLGAIDIDNSDSASAVSFSPLGDYLFVTLQGNDDVVVLDRLALNQSVGLGSFVTRRGVGSAPQGIIIDPATQQVLVKNLLDRSITFLDARELLESGQASMPSDAIETTTTEALASDILLGKTLFYSAGPRMSGEGYISCASCHLDGGHDGRIWDFTGRGEGLRNSITLRGRSGTEHGAVHWSANFDEIQDFEHDIRGFFGGSGFLSDSQFASANTPLGTPKAGLSADLDALAAYVTSLDHSSIPRSPHRTDAGSHSSAAAAGHIIFNTLDCRSCHAGPEMIDQIQHNVGTLRNSSGSRLGQILAGIETPTLRGIWATAPYLHDGSAERLEDVFSIAGGQIYPAEAGTTAQSAAITSGDTVRINSDDTARDRAFVTIEGFSTLTHTGIDGGSGGIGAIEIRYTHGDAQYPLNINVNGQDHQIQLPPVENGIPWRFVNWRQVRLEGVLLAPGNSNTIILSGTNPFFNAYIDEIHVSTPEDLTLANPHRQVLNIAAQDRSNLIAFLRDLDGSPIIDPNIPAPAFSLVPSSNSQPTRLDPVIIQLQASRGVSGLDSSDLLVGGSANPQGVELNVIEGGTLYEVAISGMENAGTVTLQIVENAAADLSGQGTVATEILTLDWEPFIDDLAPLGDEFDDSNTLSQWQRLNDTEGWNADKLELFDINSSAPGNMRIMPYTTTWFMDLTGPLVYKEISGDFAVTMRMNVQRRNGQSGRPQREFSLGGIMIRSPRNISAAAPQTNAPASSELSWPPSGYSTDWQPDTENYIFLSVGTSDNNGPDNIWNYEVKTTIDGQSNLYYGREGVPADTGLVTLQAIRRGSTFILLRQHDNGAWIVENRYDRTDMPETLQVGITTYTDWGNIMSNGMYSNSDDHSGQYHHNRNVMTAANGFAANPDLIVDVDYVHFARLRESLSQQALIDLPVSAGGPLQWLADTPLAATLGSALDQQTPPPSFGFSVDWPQSVAEGAPIEFELTFPQPVSGFEASDVIVSGTAQAQAIEVLELHQGTRFLVSITGMQQTGSVTVEFLAAMATGADGRPTSARDQYAIEWNPLFQDDLAVLSDEFTDASSMAEWQRLNDTEGWNADKLEAYDIDATTPGSMHLMPHSSTWYMDLIGPLTFKEVSGDFIATVHLDIKRRANQAGRPSAYFSLGGIMLRAPRQISAAAPQPSAPIYEQLPWPPNGYSSDWTPDGEDYLFFSAGHSIGYPENQWNIQVKNTDDGQTSLYHSAQGVPAGTGVMTLQVVRMGSTFLLLRQHGSGDWIVENRYDRPDLPETIQVGVSAYTDWGSVAGNGMFTHPGDHVAQYHQNRNVIDPVNGFGANPDLIMDVDYFRFARPLGISPAALGGMPLSAGTAEIQWLADTELSHLLGWNAPNMLGNSGLETQSLSLEDTRASLPTLSIEHDPVAGLVRVSLPVARDPHFGARHEIVFSRDLVHWRPIITIAPAIMLEDPSSQNTSIVHEIPISEFQSGFIKVNSREAPKM